MTISVWDMRRFRPALDSVRSRWFPFTTWYPPPPPLEAGHNQVNTDLWGKYLLISTSRRANLGITGGTHHPHHEVGEDGDPQSGQDERQHEAFLPASFGTVGDGKIEQQEQRP